MPLLNIPALNGNSYPVVAGICDYTGHLAKADKKDVMYIGGMFNGIVVEYDLYRNHTDMLYFDGASNVQKAGMVLAACYPWSMTFHSGKHVMTLWFSNLLQIPAMKFFFCLLFF